MQRRDYDVENKSFSDIENELSQTGEVLYARVPGQTQTTPNIQTQTNTLEPVESEVSLQDHKTKKHKFVAIKL